MDIVKHTWSLFLDIEKLDAWKHFLTALPFQNFQKCFCPLSKKTFHLPTPRLLLQSNLFLFWRILNEEHYADRLNFQEKAFMQVTAGLSYQQAYVNLI